MTGSFRLRPSIVARLAALALPLLLVVPPSAARQSPSADYVVGPQDVLSITVWDQADLSGKFTVEADGSFNFPLIGRVQAGGLTLRAIEAELKKRLADGYFKNPQLTVAVDTYRSQRVFIVGEVRVAGHLHADRRHVAHRGALARRLDDADGEHRGGDRPRARGEGRERPGAARAERCRRDRARGLERPAERRRGEERGRCATATRSSCRAPRPSTSSAR